MNMRSATLCTAVCADIPPDPLFAPVPLDVADLYQQLHRDEQMALARLADLSLAQLCTQAHAYAAYLNDRYDSDWRGDELLAIWNDAIARQENRFPARP